MFKIIANFSDIDPLLLYDVLQDTVYRAVWDDFRIEAFVIESIDKKNEVCYYSAKVGIKWKFTFHI
jgi:hypothetical protein